MGLRAKAGNSMNFTGKLLNCKSANANANNNSNRKCAYEVVATAAATTPTTDTATATATNNLPQPLMEETELRYTCTMSTTTTFRSSSTSALPVCMRPKSLPVHRLLETPTDHTQLFFREVLNAWRAKARCNVVPAERTQELFHELSFHPSEKQISEMLQTAKLLGRKGSRQSNGLTFGEFCVLAADLKRFRTAPFAVTSSSNNSSSSICDKVNQLSSLQNNEQTASGTMQALAATSNNLVNHNTHLNASQSGLGTELRSTKSFSNVEDCQKKKSQQATTAGDQSSPVEVFLGGSCNPTTWRADVAIPALKELGISFYNPQVSDWTPDLIELEHRAKEKARVLFFVMDSETRASAGAIEAAHIAGQNCKQLVLVLHPYKPKQNILNEPISEQEYIDLTRNQLILRELVTRRGLPVLDNIPSGLQRTKEILAGIRDPPSNIASILVVVRGAFDRVNPLNEAITVKQCQRALLYLGYAQGLVKLDNLNKIIASQRESLDSLHSKQQRNSTKQQQQQLCNNTEANIVGSSNSSNGLKNSNSNSSTSSTGSNALHCADINFELFCIVSSYLSVLQQEIHESGCISPIKGTNVPPPPIYLSNLHGDESFDMRFYASRNVSRNSSNASVFGEERQLNDLLTRSRDSGTSSPQSVLLEPLSKNKSGHKLAKQKTQVLLNFETVETTEVITTQTVKHANATTPTTTPTSMPIAHDSYANSQSSGNELESDSDDSVISSGSSLNSVNEPLCSFGGLDLRDVYLGGSCAARTNWRQTLAVPYLQSHAVSFHQPVLQESLQNRTQDSNSSNAWLKQIDLGVQMNLYNPALLEASRVLLFVITNETRSLAPMTLAAHCIGLMYNVVLAVQMLPEDCIIGNEKLTPAAIKDYNRGRSYLIDLAKRQGVPVFTELQPALECTVEKIKACNSRRSYL